MCHVTNHPYKDEAGPPRIPPRRHRGSPTTASMSNMVNRYAVNDMIQTYTLPRFRCATTSLLDEYGNRTTSIMDIGLRAVRLQRSVLKAFSLNPFSREGGLFWGEASTEEMRWEDGWLFPKQLQYLWTWLGKHRDVLKPDRNKSKYCAAGLHGMTKGSTTDMRWEHGWLFPRELASSALQYLRETWDGKHRDFLKLDQHLNKVRGYALKGPQEMTTVWGIEHGPPDVGSMEYTPLIPPECKPVVGDAAEIVKLNDHWHLHRHMHLPSHKQREPGVGSEMALVAHEGHQGQIEGFTLIGEEQGGDFFEDSDDDGGVDFEPFVGADGTHGDNEERRGLPSSQLAGCMRRGPPLRKAEGMEDIVPLVRRP
ncbi:unnamed protein product [Vitrella brassicaformis CCMP3155]|uniref:Uncharacterized protein n=1 Tax=Vitrella brassicaformis (strain CCMP3155) TaxID=1169540 RepID=A0A0G4GRM7_VITBC|nr:unnamed protein product [Vitrella brassicaformis CCMP3155]|eukprot:CEM33222.1 unnamed protein product [Vitrella brassicaformis CCMP3155]